MIKLERETQKATGGRGPLETGKGRRWPGCPLQNTPSAPVAARRRGLFRQRIREPAVCLGLGRCLSSVAAELCVPLMTSAFHAGSHFLSASVCGQSAALQTIIPFSHRKVQVLGEIFRGEEKCSIVPENVAGRGRRAYRRATMQGAARPYTHLSEFCPRYLITPERDVGRDHWARRLDQGRTIPSSASRACFSSPPPAYPVREPSAPTTRWQGIKIGMGLRRLASPTARKPRGQFTARAMSR